VPEPTATVETSRPSHGGRPSRSVSAGLVDVILDAATALFLRDGYGATSMESVAAAARVSKRTLYTRFADKPALLQAAVARLVTNWMPPFEAALGAPGSLEESLKRAGLRMLETALAPEALALYRLIVAESVRFPDLAHMLHQAGTRTGIVRIAALLAPLGLPDPAYAAEQFQHLVIGGPQYRALGLGPPLDAAARAAWVSQAVALFLRGIAEPR
jgi:AcrR family transcriptional regulator